MTEEDKKNYVEEKVTVKVTQHPNEKKYKNIPTYETNLALMKFLSSLTKEQSSLFSERDLVLEEEKTIELYDDITKDDKVGIIIPRHKDGRLTPMQLSVVNKIEGEDYFVGKNEVLNETYEVSFQDVSAALALGYCEILYRNDEVYGVEKEKEVTVKYYYTEETEAQVKEVLQKSKEEEDKGEV